MCFISCMASTSVGQTKTLGLLTIHPLRLASGGGSPTYHHSVCSCNTAVLRAEEWEVWWCVGERLREWGEGKAKRTGEQVNEGGRKKTCWDHCHYKTFAATMNSLENKSAFTRALTLDGNLTISERLKNNVCLAVVVPLLTTWMPAVYGTIS